MELILWITPCITGGLGAVCRYAMTRAINRKKFPEFSPATLMINALASLILGLMFGSGAMFFMRGFYTTILFASSVAGFCGGFSTFSTAIMEGVAQLQKKHIVKSLSILAVEFILPLVCMLVGYFVPGLIMLFFVQN